MNIAPTSAIRDIDHRASDHVVPLKDRVEEAPGADDLVGRWVEQMHWNMQRALLMGEGEETTGVVTVEIPEL
jgi:hypothetical protein